MIDNVKWNIEPVMCIRSGVWNVDIRLYAPTREKVEDAARIVEAALRERVEKG